MSVKPEQYDLIRSPIITEKATMASEHGARGVRGGDGRDQARDQGGGGGLFNVKVKAVNTTITKGKVKRFRGRPGTAARREEGLRDARRGQHHRRDHRALKTD